MQKLEASKVLPGLEAFNFKKISTKVANSLDNSEGS